MFIGSQHPVKMLHNEETKAKIELASDIRYEKFISYPSPQTFHVHYFCVHYQNIFQLILF
jgi:hypothetical protein